MDPSVHPSTYVTAREAIALLGVKLETLYAYVSRGLVRSVPGEGRRARRYARADLERLRTRRDARAGHGAVAASALTFGEPVLDSAVTEITDAGPRYRGALATELATARVGFERVAELLFTGVLPDAAANEPRVEVDSLGVPLGRLASLVPAGTPPFGALGLAIGALALADPSRFGASRAAELTRARVLLRRLAAALAIPLAHVGATREDREDRVERALAAPTLAHAVAIALGARRVAEAAPAIDRALVLAADHELNPSSFAARIAASAGGDLYACLAAALATLSGPRHGGACDRVEAFVDAVNASNAANAANAGRAPSAAGAEERVSAAIAARLQRGEAIPGFGHPLYPAGDPRATLLLDDARALVAGERVTGEPRASRASHAPKRTRARTLLAIVGAMREAGHEPPTLDAGLCALAMALGLPRGSALALFAIGRTAGWIAHVLEQRRSETPLRPRARYVGP
jgi:citrate synthase